MERQRTKRDSKSKQKGKNSQRQKRNFKTDHKGHHPLEVHIKATQKSTVATTRRKLAITPRRNTSMSTKKVQCQEGGSTKPLREGARQRKTPKSKQLKGPQPSRKQSQKRSPKVASQLLALANTMSDEGSQASTYKTSSKASKS